MKRILSVFSVFLILSVPAAVQAQYGYVTNANKTSITVTNYTGPGGAVTIPSTIKGLTVSAIGQNAFRYQFNVTSVTIPNTVTTIEASAFVVSGLTNATIPEGVLTIGESAFSYTSLASVEIPASVTNIEVLAFGPIYSLTNIDVDSGNAFYSSAAGVLFNKNETVLEECPAGDTGSYTLPGTVTNVHEDAFTDCSSLANVTIPDSVSIIGDNAFSRCSSLTNLVIPNSVTNIGAMAFGYCSKLIQISVSSANPSFSSLAGVLFNKNATLLVQYPNGLGGIFSVPETVTKIGDNAFLGCSGLVGLTFPGGIASIGSNAFFQCVGLPSITIPATVTNIGDSAFAELSSLTNACFEGNASANFSQTMFAYDQALSVVRYVSGTTGWRSTLGGFPTAPCVECIGGALKTTISPPDAVSAGAQWEIDGGTQQTAGTTVPGLAPGQYRVTFTPISGWNTPAAQTVTITNLKTTTASAIYTIGFGSVTVTLSPPDAVSAGAQWSLDGGPDQNSSVTITNLPTGSHTISFTAISGWSTPLSQTISITNNATTSVTGIYAVSTGQGALSVTLSPSAAVSAGAQWQVDGGPAQKSGATLTNIPAGSHILSFTTIPEWNSPLSETVIISNDATTIATGVYTSIGALTVIISPAGAISDGAQWLVDGGVPQPSGATVTNLIGGPHTLTFTRISHYNVPVDQTIIITNQSTTRTSGTYTTGIKGAPKVAITTPKPSQSVSNALFTIAGTASDKVPINHVYYQLNGGSWNTATTTGSWAKWTASVNPSPGANTLSTYALDTSFVSYTNKVAFKFIPSAMLAVQTTGSGVFTPKDNGALLAIGTNYTLTATPAKNWIFSNWVASDSENFVSNSTVLKFKMASNLVLTANFIPNPFLAAQGNYAGLFAPDAPPRDQTNSGAINFTVTGAGVLSGKLTIGANAPVLSGKFTPGGMVTIVTLRKNLSALTTTLQLDFAGQSVSGTVGDGSFLASVTGDKAVFSAANVATAYKGQYTLTIPGTNDPTVGPFGSSYGTVTVAPGGGITFAGSLADGTTVSQTSFVSKDGYWPFYLPLYNGNGSLWSWNYFSNKTIVPSSDASWINFTNPSKTALYRTGFTNSTVSILSSPYNPATHPLLALTNGQITLEGGNVPDITNQFILTEKNTISLTNAADTNKLKLTINKNTGVISGSFLNPSNVKQTIKINGVLLQNETNAAGYFIGTGQSGAFFVSPF